MILCLISQCQDLIMNLLNSLQPAEVVEGEWSNPSSYDYWCSCIRLMVKWYLISNFFNFVSAAQNGKLPPLPRSPENNGSVSIFIYILILWLELSLDFFPEITLVICLLLWFRAFVWAYAYPCLILLTLAIDLF